MYNGNKVARAMIAYIWENMWQIHVSKQCYNKVHEPFLLLRNRGKPQTSKNLTLVDGAPKVCESRWG